MNQDKINKQIFERLKRLEIAVFRNKEQSIVKKTKEFKEITEEIDFDIPLRPFVKKYTKGMSGPKKFTLLVAWFVKGDLKKEAALSEIRKNWNKMSSKTLLNMKFNLFYTNQAKENDWVDSKRKGFYNLRPNWKGILQSL
jgi:hypothetical protein